MFAILKLSNIRNYHLAILGFILWLYICSIIGAYPLSFDSLQTIIFSDSNFFIKGVSTFNFLRSNNFYYTPFLILLIYFYKKKIKSITFVNLYLLFFLTQIVGTLLLLDVEKFSYTRNFLLYNSINTLLVIYFLSINELKNYLKYFLILTIILLATIIVYNLYKIIEEYIYTPNMFFFYNSQLWDKLVIGNSHISVFSATLGSQ